MFRMVVFGAGGFIGGCLAQAARCRGWQVCALDHSACDVTNSAQVEDLLAGLLPNAVLNPAARANIDWAETNREAAYQVNVTGALNVARACARLELRLIHYSTDAVFPGSAQPLREDDPPQPINYYGYTKMVAEQAVLAACPSAVILRVSLALGFPAAQHGNSFLAMLHDRLSNGVEVFAPQTEIRTPVDIHTLANASLELAQKRVRGVLHIGATQSVDRYSLTLRLAQMLGLDPSLVRAAGTPAPGRAPRHAVSILDVSRIRSVLQTPMLNMEDTLARAITRLPLDNPPQKT